MEILRTITHPVDTIRTAPVGLAEVALGSGVAAPFIVEAILNPDATHVAEAITASVLGLGGLARIGIHSIGRQFRIRRRAESLTTLVGFPDYYLETHTHHWCDRQTVRNLYRNDPEKLAAYQELCDKSRIEPKFTWLPHF